MDCVLWMELIESSSNLSYQRNIRNRHTPNANKKKCIIIIIIYKSLLDLR